MGRERRMFHHNGVYMVANRLCEGLPFVPNLIMNILLWGLIARSVFKYKAITLCAAVFLQNHYHILVVLRGDPSDLRDFMNYINGELGKYLRILLGAKFNKKYWSQRYTAIKLLTPRDVIRELIYIYANPVSANLVAKAAHWFGVGTFTPDLQPIKKRCSWYKPSQLFALPNAKLSVRSISQLVSRLKKQGGEEYEFTVDPLAWMDTFNEKLDPEQIKTEVLSGLSKIEKSEEIDRQKSGRHIPKKAELECQNPYKHYIPTKYQRRVFCICEDQELRKEFIEMYQDFCRRCKQAYEKLKNGDRNVLFPDGAFLPPLSPRSNYFAPC